MGLGTINNARLKTAYADESGVLHAGQLFVIGALFVDDERAAERELAAILERLGYQKSIEWKASDKKLVAVYSELLPWFWQRKNMAFTSLVFPHLMTQPGNLILPAADGIALPGFNALSADALDNRLFRVLLDQCHLKQERNPYMLRFERRSEAQAADLHSYLQWQSHRFTLQGVQIQRKADRARLLQFTDLLTSGVRRSLLDSCWPDAVVPLRAPSKRRTLELMKDLLRSQGPGATDSHRQQKIRQFHVTEPQ